MGFRLTTIFIYAAMLVIGVALLLAILYLIHGSFEMVPSDEQHDKVRWVMAVVMAGLVAAEAMLWGLIRYVRRTEEARQGLH